MTPDSLKELAKNVYDSAAQGKPDEQTSGKINFGHIFTHLSRTENGVSGTITDVIAAMDSFKNSPATDKEKQQIGFLGDALIRSEIFPFLNLHDRVKLRVATAKIHGMSPMATAIKIQETACWLLGLRGPNIFFAKNTFRCFLEELYKHPEAKKDPKKILTMAINAYTATMADVSYTYDDLAEINANFTRNPTDSVEQKKERFIQAALLVERGYIGLRCVKQFFAMIEENFPDIWAPPTK